MQTVPCATSVFFAQRLVVFRKKMKHYVDESEAGNNSFPGLYDEFEITLMPCLFAVVIRSFCRPPVVANSWSCRYVAPPSVCIVMLAPPSLMCRLDRLFVTQLSNFYAFLE
jgi:hypothetical protein